MLLFSAFCPRRLTRDIVLLRVKSLKVLLLSKFLERLLINLSIKRSPLNLVSGGRMPTYLLEHLATFTVSPENDLVYPADGMRRLLAMEKTSGIWTQKVKPLPLDDLHI